MYIKNQMHMMHIMMPAMAKAIGIEIPQYLTLPYMDMIDRVSNDVDLEITITWLFVETTLTMSQSTTLVRMTGTLWRMIKELDLPKDTIQ